MHARELLKRTPARPLVRAAGRLWQLQPARTEIAGFVVRIPRRDLGRYVQGFEPLTIDWTRHVVRPGMTVVDVGAALGMFRLDLWRLVGPSGRVIAIEPAESNTKLLARNARANNATIEVIQAAASNEDGFREFLLTDSSDSHAFYHHPLIDPSRAVQVRTVRLDSIVENADFIKIDVEGAEVEVLEGAGRLLKDRPPLVVEWVPSCQLAAGNQLADLPALLDRLGYNLQVFDEISHVATTVDDTLAAYEQGDIPIYWYANICCTSSLP
ncbi:MAG: FkbM family methyltransferase [Acidimicrobiales bacterium]